MPTAISEFEAQVDAVRADLEFVKLAAQLRPRIGSILIWNAKGDGTDIAKQFIKARSLPEGVYASLLVRLVATLERYLRNMIAEAVHRRAAKAKSYDEVASTLGSRNLVLTGRLLASLDQPKDYLTLNIEELVENLASCKKGSSAFKLNLLAFSAAMVGVTPTAIEKAMDTVDVSKWLDRNRHGHRSRRSSRYKWNVRNRRAG